MFKYIKGTQQRGLRSVQCLLIWLNNIPISHGEVATRFNVRAENAGFCNINKDALEYNFFTAYGEAPSLRRNSEGLNFTELANFIREGDIEFEESSYVALVVLKSANHSALNFNLSRREHTPVITFKEMVDKYDIMFQRLYPDE